MAAPPDSSRPPSAELAAEADIADAATPAVARAAGGLLLFAGVLVAAAGLQLFALVKFFGAFAVAPYAHVALGVVQMLCGLMVFRGRAWAASIAAVLSGALFCLTSAWLVVSFTRGIFSLLALGNPIILLLAAGLTALSIKPCERASEARARLTAQGMGVGL